MSLTRPDGTGIGHATRHDQLAPVPIRTLERISFFKRTDNLVLYKKTERICAAIFVVSDGIVSDSLRERIRAEALGIFSGVRDAIGRRGSVAPSDANVFALGVASLVSVLELACRVGEITESNYSLIRHECLRLTDLLAETAAGTADVLDRRIFDSGLRESETAPLPTAPSRPHSARTPREAPSSYKGHQKDTIAPIKPAMSFKGSARDFIASLGDSIEDRESKIIEIVKNKEKVSIKDISDAMPGVGEKTIQRALVSLVTRGVLKKEGERRWSRYALAQATLAV